VVKIIIEMKHLFCKLFHSKYHVFERPRSSLFQGFLVKCTKCDCRFFKKDKIALQVTKELFEKLKKETNGQIRNSGKVNGRICP
jgi:hypothetical protein